MGARLWKCSREQIRLATEEEGLSKEVALALSQEMLDDVDSGRSARFIDVTSDGAPPAEAVIARMVEPSQDLPEEPEAAVPPDAPSGSEAPPSGHSADGAGVDPPGTVAALPDATLIRPREELPAAAAVEPPRSRPRLPSTPETTSEPEREVTLEETMRHLRQLERAERQETRAAASAAACG